MVILAQNGVPDLECIYLHVWISDICAIYELIGKQASVGGWLFLLLIIKSSIILFKKVNTKAYII